MWTLAAVGSKLEGTGFEKLQMVQTQVADVFACGSAGGTYGLSARPCELGLARPGAGDKAVARVWREDRFKGLGTSVTLADDLRNPA